MLQPGRLYCIYDYQTIINETAQVKSNKNVYPIVLLAISQSMFSPNCWMFVGNTPFYGAKLYISDTDYYVNVGPEKTGGVYKWKWVNRKDRNWTSSILYTDKPNYPGVSEDNKLTIKNIEFIRYKNYDGGIDTTIFNSTYPWKGDQIVEIKYDIRTSLGRKYSNDYITANSSGNKGFIYWMKDMNGNEADFDLYSITWSFTDQNSVAHTNELTIKNNAKHNKIFNVSNIILSGDKNIVNNSSNVISTGNENTLNNSSNVYCTGSYTTLNYSNNNKITIDYCYLEDSTNNIITISGVIPTTKIKMYSCNRVIINGTDYTLSEPILMYNIDDKTIQLPNVNGPLVYRSSLTREILL